MNTTAETVVDYVFGSVIPLIKWWACQNGRRNGSITMCKPHLCFKSDKLVLVPTSRSNVNLRLSPGNRRFYMEKCIVVLEIDLLYVFCVAESEFLIFHQILWIFWKKIFLCKRAFLCYRKNISRNSESRENLQQKAGTWASAWRLTSLSR